MEIETERLILRQWRASDFEPFAKMNKDPRVREFFSSISTEEESNKSAKILSTSIEERGWGFWAVSVPNVSEFIGFIGLQPIPFTAHFTPAVEIGWRLAYDFWGFGYATEGAKAALRYGFEELNLEEIVSITTVANMRSRNVMEKIGMTHVPEDDFDHPNLPDGHNLKRHVLYRIKAPSN
jgi:3-dehydroquinate dehydratase / shikimate dehydrogenase